MWRAVRRRRAWLACVLVSIPLIYRVEPVAAIVMVILR